MSAYYNLYQTPDPSGEEDKKKLHARILPKGTITADKFRDPKEIRSPSIKFQNMNLRISGKKRKRFVTMALDGDSEIGFSLRSIEINQCFFLSCKLFSEFVALQRFEYCICPSEDILIFQLPILLFMSN